MGISFQVMNWVIPSAHPLPMPFGLESFDLEALDRLRAERLQAGDHQSLGASRERCRVSSLRPSRPPLPVPPLVDYTYPLLHT